jgi:DNA polymerase/3'-5' exonuclease PolX
MAMDDIIQGFRDLATFCDILTDTSARFKKRQYLDAIRILKRYDGEMNLEDITAHFKASGKKNPKKVLAKINEYLTTGGISEVETARSHPEFQAMLNLSLIYGVGPKKVKKLYEEHAVITIDDVRALLEEHPKALNNKQKIGVRYYEHLLEKIPRAEIDEFRGIFEDMVDETMMMSINGSYRRGLHESGDIDILIASSSKASRTRFIERLVEAGILVEELAMGQHKYIGIGQLPNGTPRHIDIIECSIKEFPFSQLYFTGSKTHNVYMRGVAVSQGFTMNEFGITHVDKTPLTKDEILDRISKTHFENERNIFDFLGIMWKEPSER